MPLYVVNVLPRAKFEEIYKISEICYIRVTFERFQGTNIVKHCYRYQKFDPSSEICNISPRVAQNVQAPTLPQSVTKWAKLPPNVVIVLSRTRLPTMFALRPLNFVKIISLFLKLPLKKNQKHSQICWRKPWLTATMSNLLLLLK